MSEKKSNPEQFNNEQQPLNNERMNPIDELIATGQAAFIFIRHSNLKPELKNAFYVLEKEFNLQAQLVQQLRNS